MLHSLKMFFVGLIITTALMPLAAIIIRMTVYLNDHGYLDGFLFLLTFIALSCTFGTIYDSIVNKNY